jgi:hypothetical protein
MDYPQRRRMRKTVTRVRHQQQPDSLQSLEPGRMRLLVSRQHRSVTVCTGTGKEMPAGIRMMSGTAFEAEAGGWLPPAEVCNASADGVVVSAEEEEVHGDAVVVAADGADLLVTVSGECLRGMLSQRCGDSCYHLMSAIDTATTMMMKRGTSGWSLDAPVVLVQHQQLVPVVPGS